MPEYQIFVDGDSVDFVLADGHDKALKKRFGNDLFYLPPREFKNKFGAYSGDGQTSIEVINIESQISKYYLMKRHHYNTYYTTTDGA